MSFSRLLNCLLFASKLYSQPIILGYIFWYKGIVIKVYLIWKELDYNWSLCERGAKIIWYCRKVTMYCWHVKRMYQWHWRARWLSSFNVKWYSAFLLLINLGSKRKKTLIYHFIWSDWSGFSKSFEEFIIFSYPTIADTWSFLTRSVRIWE